MGVTYFFLNGQKAFDYGRTIDIVLGTGSSETWVEVKSKAWPYKKEDYSKWSVTQTKSSSIHKEFTTDLVAHIQKKLDAGAIGNVKLHWRYHKFKTKNNLYGKGPDQKEFDGFEVKKKLCDMSERSSAKDILEETSGVPVAFMETTCKALPNLVGLQGAKSILKDLLDNAEFTDIRELFDSEFFTED